MTVRSTRVSIPCSLSSRNFSTARATSAGSSQSSVVFSISGLRTKMCSCMRVRPNRAPSTGPPTVLTWTIALPSTASDRRRGAGRSRRRPDNCLSGCEGTMPQEAHSLSCVDVELRMVRWVGRREAPSNPCHTPIRTTHPRPGRRPRAACATRRGRPSWRPPVRPSPSASWSPMPTRVRPVQARARARAPRAGRVRRPPPTRVGVRPRRTPARPGIREVSRRPPVRAVRRRP